MMMPSEPSGPNMSNHEPRRVDNECLTVQSRHSQDNLCLRFGDSSRASRLFDAGPSRPSLSVVQSCASHQARSWLFLTDRKTRTRACRKDCVPQDSSGADHDNSCVGYKSWSLSIVQFRSPEALKTKRKIGSSSFRGNQSSAGREKRSFTSSGGGGMPSAWPLLYA